jgi:hypothetical protein
MGLTRRAGATTSAVPTRQAGRTNWAGLTRRAADGTPGRGHRGRAGAGIGLSLPPSMNTGTFGVAPDDAGVASATLNVGQQIGGSIGTALLNTIATSAAASCLSPAIAASRHAERALQAAAAVHGYTTAFWWTAGMFAAGAIASGTLFRRGPLAGSARPAPPGARASQPTPAPSART